MRGEFGAGISALWMASAEPSSTRRVRRVKTERIKNIIIKRLIIRKMVRPRRMVTAVLGADSEIRRRVCRKPTDDGRSFRSGTWGRQRRGRGGVEGMGSP